MLPHSAALPEGAKRPLRMLRGAAPAGEAQLLLRGETGSDPRLRAVPSDCILKVRAYARFLRTRNELESLGVVEAR